MLLAVAGLSAGVVLPAAPASAATQSCNFATAGTGTFANTLCWFDLSSYNATAAASGQPITIAIPGGSSMSFTLTVSGGPVKATTFPTYSGAYLGNSGHYSGVAGSPALYQTSSGTTTTATLTNISVTNAAGAKQTGFALVGADAESTNTNESITWNSSAPITSLTASGTSTGLGNACGGGFTGVGTTTVKCTGNINGAMTGTAILASTNPTTFSQKMVGGGLEGVAFGVLVSSVQLNTNIVNGFPGDACGINGANSDGTTLASANTNGSASASTGKQTVVVDSTGATYGLNQQITSGLASNYTTTWSCTRNGQVDPSLPSGQTGYNQLVNLGIGDSVICTITNTAKAATIGIVKHAGTPTDVNGDGLTDAGDTIPYTFTVTNTGALTLSGITVTDAKVGAVTCAAATLAPSASTTCTATTPYTVTAADVTHGSVDNSATASGFAPGVTTAVTSTPSTTSTPVVAPAPALSVVKSADPSSAAAYQTGQVVNYSFVITNTGNVTMSGITVDDSNFSGSGTTPSVTCPAGAASLAPQAQVTCTATYTLTQADVNAGDVSNTATATGT
ncbi:MAG: hypothetical protein JWP75_3010, partial [Frondihabitans sp.]|nr:hypothetical protein [Frondihabitans sp.]